MSRFLTSVRNDKNAVLLPDPEGSPCLRFKSIVKLQQKTKLAATTPITYSLIHQ